MIPNMCELATGLMVLGFLSTLPTVASANTQPRASGIGHEYRVGCCDTVKTYRGYSVFTWADIQGIRLVVRMP
jgi:hypothetical protein